VNGPRRFPLRATATLCLLAIVLAAACTRKPAVVDPAYRAEIEAWRAARVAALTAPDGWLSLVGLVWLRPGPNRFGSDPGDEIVLPGAGVPAVAGAIDLRPDGTAVLEPGAGAAVTVGGAAAGERPLRSDRDGKPDIVALGTYRFYVIDRAGTLGVRVKDTASPARAQFKGIAYFPLDPAYRVIGTFEPYPAPREVRVATHQGPSQTMLAPGLVRFSLGGRSLALEPFVSPPADRTFFFVFRDATSGHQTYGAGRFLDADAPPPGGRTVVLDFNKATNPPCAFTPFATCPLPPPANELPVRVAAGEMASGHH
jgi:uncharacterized protein (DUF1684 family)